jgi:hypothetical protein
MQFLIYTIASSEIAKLVATVFPEFSALRSFLQRKLTLKAPW